MASTIFVAVLVYIVCLTARPFPPFPTSLPPEILPRLQHRLTPVKPHRALWSSAACRASSTCGRVDEVRLRCRRGLCIWKRWFTALRWDCGGFTWHERPATERKERDCEYHETGRGVYIASEQVVLWGRSHLF